jgi:hypothetical protein
MPSWHERHELPVRSTIGALRWTRVGQHVHDAVRVMMPSETPSRSVSTSLMLEDWNWGRRLGIGLGIGAECARDRQCGNETGNTASAAAGEDQGGALLDGKERELPTVRYTHVHIHRLMVRREMHWSPMGRLCHMQEQVS